MMKSLRKLIVFLVLVLTIVASLCFFWTSILNSKRAVKSTITEDLAIVAQTVAADVSANVQTKLEAMSQVGNTRIFKDESVPLEVKQDQLDSITKEDPRCIGYNFLDAQGNLRILNVGMKNFGKSEFFTRPVAGESVVVGPSINNVSNESTLFYGTPVKNYDGKIIGTLLIAANGDILCDACSNIKIGSTGHVIIIDRNTGNTVGSSNRDDVLNMVNFPELAKEDPSTAALSALYTKLQAGEISEGFYKENNVDKYMSFCPVSGTSWSVAVLVDWSQYAAKLKPVRDNVFLISLISILFGLLIAIIIGKSLKPLKQVGASINEISTGNADLTQRLSFKNPKLEIEEVVNGFNNFVEKLQDIVKALKKSQENLAAADNELQSGTQETTASITQIIANIESVNSQIINQSGSVDETASAVNEIASNIESLENMITNQSNSVAQASSAIEQMIGNITSVNSSVEKMVSSFQLLQQNASLGMSTQKDVNERLMTIEEQSKMLQDANKAIASIASQTNLLAMNAAIEAAHAGEAGKGFSVVADEIRKLSETSSSQSKTIGEELKKIQDSIFTVVDASGKATEAFNSVSENIDNTNMIIDQIKAAMEEQQIGSKQIISSLSAMNDSTSEVKSASEEMAEGNKQILSEINRLQEATSIMKDSITEMSAGAKKIKVTGSALSSISEKVTESINQIGNEIDQFKI